MDAQRQPNASTSLLLQSEDALSATLIGQTRPIQAQEPPSSIIFITTKLLLLE